MEKEKDKIVCDKVWKRVYENKERGKYDNKALLKFVVKNFYKEKDRKKIKIFKIDYELEAELWLQCFHRNCKSMRYNSSDLIVI